MKLTTYLFFAGNCQEAMEFYKSCLGGELEITTVEQAGQSEQLPDQKDNVMHSTLKSADFELMASDLVMGGNAEHGNDVSICISTDTDNKRAEEIMNKMAEGGKVEDPFQETFFGYFGRVTDKYGIRWMFEAD